MRCSGGVMEAYPCIRCPDEACKSKYSTSMTSALLRKHCRILFACLVPVTAWSQQVGRWRSPAPAQRQWHSPVHIQNATSP